MNTTKEGSKKLVQLLEEEILIDKDCLLCGSVDVKGLNLIAEAYHNRVSQLETFYGRYDLIDFVQFKHLSSLNRELGEIIMGILNFRW